METAFLPRRHPSISGLKYLTAGKSGLVYRTEDGRIYKKYHDDTGQTVEHEAYKRLVSRPNIARFLGCTDSGIILESGRVLRDALKGENVPLDEKLRWIGHAARGLQYIHAKDIIQADVGCHNMILTADCSLELIDFEGCSIDGAPADSSYEWFSYKCFQGVSISIQTDIFAFGCAIFEIITGRVPYDEYSASDNRDSIVEQLYNDNRFPDTTHLPLGQLIQGCWDGTLDSMSDVIQQLAAFNNGSGVNDEGVPAQKMQKSLKGLFKGVLKHLCAHRISMRIR